MAYVAVPDSWTNASEPTKEEIFKYLVNNQDSFNTDIEALKQASRIDMFNIIFAGYIEQYSEADILARIPVYRSDVDLTITSVSIVLLENSGSGTLEMDLEVSTDNGVSWSSRFTTTLDLTGTTVGSTTGSVPWINAAAQDINEGDLVRVRLTGAQVDQGDFHVKIYGEAI